MGWVVLGRRLIVLALLAQVAVAIGACARAARLDETIEGSEPLLYVESGHPVAVELFVVRRRSWVRLGQVSAAAESVLRVPPDRVGRGAVRLVARSTLDDDWFISDEVWFLPGSVVHLRLGLPLWTSVVIQ